ncbi:DNA repair protein RadC [Massilia sp. UMI-21]|nr:DNA repair protein RadC [Massilia sp. UMI-21]
MRITEWPKEQRPRERLLRGGPGVLSDSELLAIFLRVGVAGKSAVALARDILDHFGSLHRLLHASAGEFGALHGLGPAKYAQLQAAVELTRRATAEEFEREAFCSPEAVRIYLRHQFALQAHESFVVLFVDVKNRLITYREMFRGTLTHTSVYPREVVKAALQCNCAAVILAHNHPSGVAEPSEADLRLTSALVQALALVDIRVLDHFVVAGAQVHSFAEHGQL